MLIEQLCACPVCHARFAAADDTLKCTGCHRNYPIVDGVPVLVAEPLRYLGAVARQYEQAIAGSEAMAKKIRLAMKEPEVAFRVPLLERVAFGVERRIAFFRTQQAGVVARLKRDAQKKGAKAAQEEPKFGEVFDARYGPGALNYLRMDWGGDPESEAGLARIESVLLRQIEKYCDRQDGVAVLGAGTGRFLFDLARTFPTAVGVDLSYPFVHAFHRLAAEELSGCLVELVGPYSRDKMVIDFTARLPADRTPLERLVYPVGNALALPLASQSVSTVILAFFADVVPLPPLLAELKRVLKPNGRVINYGTLGYHFSNFAWFLAPEEVEEVIESKGFVFEEQSWSEMQFFEHPSSFRRSCRVWSYVLRAPGV
jgi:uncharacterized protein YbaR (Trm112 family)/SAM-dependent methyltransferase